MTSVEPWHMKVHNFLNGGEQYLCNLVTSYINDLNSTNIHFYHLV